MQFCGKHHIGLHWSFTYTLVCVMMWKTNRIAKKRFSRLCVCPLSVTVFGDKHFSLCGFLPWCGVLTCQCSAGDLALFFLLQVWQETMFCCLYAGPGSGRSGGGCLLPLPLAAGIPLPPRFLCKRSLDSLICPWYVTFLLLPRRFCCHWHLFVCLCTR